MEKRDKLVLTVKDVAAYLQVNQTTIYRLLRQSKIPGFKLGGDWRFNLESIDEWRLAAGGKPTLRTQPRAKSAPPRRTGTDSARNAEAHLSSPSRLAELQLPAVLAQLHGAINSLVEPLAELRAMIPTLKGITDGVADPREASDEDAEISDVDGKLSSVSRETVLDSAPLAYGLVDRQRRMASYNDAFCELFEFSREQLRARDFFDLMCEEDRAVNKMIFTKLLAGEPEAGSLVGRAVTRKGRSILVKIHVWGVPRKRPPRPDYVAAILQQVATSNEATKISFRRRRAAFQTS